MNKLSFEQQLTNYADLIVKYGMNVQPKQLVRIGIDAFNRDFGLLLTKKAYEAGASYVLVDLIDRRYDRERLIKQNQEELKFVPPFIVNKFNYLADNSCATASIRGEEDPDLMMDLPEDKLNTLESSMSSALEYFYEEGISKNKLSWTVAAAATPNWAKRLFPNLSTEAALEKLWENILKICRCDHPNYLEAWEKHDLALSKRSTLLDSLKIDHLHFFGDNCDLKVGLLVNSTFAGGRITTANGSRYEPNLPTEECFTTPNLWKTEGYVKSTRPVLINGKLVKGLKMQFSKGKLIDFSAEEGEKTFEQLVNTDEGSRYLGEVALVGIDSPVYQSGIIFESILYDENAACHIALGRAYKSCVRNIENTSAEDLKIMGVNSSIIHKDIMISSEKINVNAITSSGESIEVIRSGKWTSKFL